MLNLSLICGFLNNIKETFFISLAVGIAILIIWLMIKFESARWFVGCIFTFVLVTGAIFSGFKLNKYYNTSGGIYGELTSIFQPSDLEIDDTKTNKVTFDFSNVKMLQDTENNSVYVAEFTTKNYIALNELNLYGVFVNGMPCDVIDYQEDYILADYHYLFTDETLEPIMIDTLSFRFVFYKNQTRLIVKTFGGDDAVKLWNSYFANESFLVSIEKNDQAYYFTENYVGLEFYDGENLINSVKLPRDTSYILPKAPDKDTSYFIGWTDAKGNFYTDTISSFTNVKLYAVYEDFLKVKFHLNIQDIDTNSNLFKTYLSKDSETLVLPTNTPTRYGFKFVGWSLDKENVVNLDNYIVTNDVTFYAVWDQVGYYVSFEATDGTFSYNNTVYNNDLTTIVLYDTNIVIDNVEKDGYTFVRYIFRRYNSKNNNFDTVIVTNENFNVSLKQLVEKIDGVTADDPQEPSYNPNETSSTQKDDFKYVFFITIQFLKDSENLAEFTEYDLIDALYDLMPYEHVSYYRWLEDYFREFYYINYGTINYDLSLVDLLEIFVDITGFDFVVDPDGDPRDVLILLYNNKDWLLENGYFVARNFPIIGD